VVPWLVHSWQYLLGSGLLGTVGLGWLVRRYQRSAGRELQSFRSYVLGSVRLSVRRRFDPVLARRFGVRPYAQMALTTFPRHMPIPSQRRRRVDIERAYVRLSLAASPERRIHDEALLSSTAGAALVFGEPGSGKSSLTRKLYREALKRAYLRPFRSRLPIHLELGRLPWDSMPAGDDALSGWLRELLRTALRKVPRVHEPGFVFDAFANGPGLLLFLDGLDEVPADQLPRAQRVISGAIEEMRLASPDTLLIVTARTQLRAMLSRTFVDSFGEVLTITPFSPADVFAFLRRWDFPADRRMAESQRIFERLRRNPTLSAMCTNPLVLSMYVAEDEAHTGAAGGTAVRLADTRSRFYDQVVGELLYYRREEQRGEVGPAGTRLLVTRQELLGRIALDHLLDSEDPTNCISLARAVKIAHRYWRAPSTEAAIQDLVRLAVDTGIVTEQVPGQSLQFIHLTLCEYLAGKELAERDERQLAEVLDRVSVDDPDARRLWETAIFAVALSKRDPRERALRRLAERGAPGELVLRMIREVQSYELPAFREAVASATKNIADRPVAEWDAGWIEQVRLLLSCLADAARLAAVRDPGPVPTVSAWLADLVGTDQARLDRVLDLYLAASPAEALRVADELGIRGRLIADRDRMTAAMEHPDLVALGMAAVVAGGDGAVEWIGLLAEAALRHELVAQILREEQIPEPVRVLAEAVDARHSWHRTGPVAGTFYGAVLAIATTAVRLPIEPGVPVRVGLVDLVGQVPPVERMKWMRPPALMFLPLAALVVFLLADDLGRWRAILTALAVLTILWMFWVGMRGSVGDTDSSIPRLLNLEPRPQPEDDVPEVVATRFPDGVVRLYVGDGYLRFARQLPVAEVQRSLILGLSAVLDDHHHGVAIDTILDYPALHQAYIVCRASGARWCVPQRPRFRTVLFGGPDRVNRGG
jgi:hypothetical protein